MNKDPFFTILVSIPLKPGCAKEFLALLDDLFAAMHSEPTFVNATALQSTDDPDTIVRAATTLVMTPVQLLKRLKCAGGEAQNPPHQIFRGIRAQLRRPRPGGGSAAGAAAQTR